MDGYGNNPNNRSLDKNTHNNTILSNYSKLFFIIPIGHTRSNEKGSKKYKISEKTNPRDAPCHNDANKTFTATSKTAIPPNCDDTKNNYSPNDLSTLCGNNNLNLTQISNIYSQTAPININEFSVTTVTRFFPAKIDSQAQNQKNQQRKLQRHPKGPLRNLHEAELEPHKTKEHHQQRCQQTQIQALPRTQNFQPCKSPKPVCPTKKFNFPTKKFSPQLPKTLNEKKPKKEF
jgi:hypothetical protein